MNLQKENKLPDFDRRESLLLGRVAGLYAARLAFKNMTSRLPLKSMREFYEGIEAEESQIRKELSDLYYMNNCVKQAEGVLAK